MSLITQDQAVAHLRLTLSSSSPPTDVEADLTLKIAQAEDIILDYLKVLGSSPSWDTSSVPPLVQAAVLLQLGELWRFRGDDQAGTVTAVADGQLSPMVTNLLRRYRDPALA